MTLLEVVIATFVVSMMAIGISATLIQNMKLMYSATFHTAGISSCIDKLEELKTKPISQLPPGTTTDQPVLTHTYAPDRVDVMCTRTVVISHVGATDDFDRKVTITVQWTFQGRQSQESLTTVLYQ